MRGIHFLGWTLLLPFLFTHWIAPSATAAEWAVAPTEISGGGTWGGQLPADGGLALPPAERSQPGDAAAKSRGREFQPGLASAPGDALAPAVILPGIGFDGFSYTDNVNLTGFRIIPPDPIGAAGPDRVIAVGNVLIEARTKAGALLYRQTLKNFFSTTAGNLGTLTFDPKVIYDHYAGRFLVVTLERTSGPNESRILVAVSKTSTPATATAADWWFTSINSKLNIGGVDHWADYPGFEIDEEAVYITNNMVRFTDGVIDAQRLWIMNKGLAGGFYAGGAAAVTVHDPIVASGGFVMNMMPAEVHGATGIGPGIGTFLVGYNGLTQGGAAGQEALQIIRINNPLAAVTFTLDLLLVGNLEDIGGAFGFPDIPDAPQSGTATLIEVNDRRTLDAVWRDQRLWLTTTINPRAGVNNGQATAHWFKLNTAAVVNSGSPAGVITVDQQGDIGGEDIAAATATFFPSVAVNGAGEAKFGFSASASTIFAGAYVTGRQVADPANTVQASSVVKAGTDYYIRFLSGTRNRWGDYSGISVDPADDATFWVFNQYAGPRGDLSAGEDGRWFTAWRQCKFEPTIAEPPPPYLSQFGGFGSGTGQFNFPQGAAVDDCGNVYVCDSANDRVQKFDKTGAFLLAWGSTGTGDGQFNNPVGIAVDGNRLVYVTDSGNNRVQKFDEFGAYVSQWGTGGTGNGQFSLPIGIGASSSGQIFVADLGNNRVQRFTPTGVYQIQWGTGGTGTGQFNSPGGLAVDRNGNVFVADGGNNRVQKFDSNGAFLATWGSNGTANGQFDFPALLSTNEKGDVFVPDANNNRIQKFDNNGNFLTKWGTFGGGNGQFDTPIATAVDLYRDDVYVVDRSNNRVQKFGVADPMGPPFVLKWGSPGSAPGQFSTPSGIEVSSTGIVHVLDRGNARVQQFNAMGGFIAQWGSAGSGSGQFNNPQDVTVDAAGQVYVADLANNRVQKFDMNGTFLLAWGTLGSGDGQFNGPGGVTVDASGNVYVTEVFNNRVQKFTSNGVFLTKWGSAGSGNGQFNFPLGITVDAAGNVYVADELNYRIQKFNSSGGYLTQWGSQGVGPGLLNDPTDVEADAFGNIYVVDFAQNRRIQIFDTNGVYKGQWGCRGIADARFDRPRGIGVDVDGDVYVVEDGNTRVQRFGLGTVAVDDGPAPARLVLHGAIPNPMRGASVLRFDLPRAGSVSLRIYDLRGRMVRQAMAAQSLAAGRHEWSWDGRTDDGRRVMPGIYFTQLRVGDEKREHKIVVMD